VKKLVIILISAVVVISSGFSVRAAEVPPAVKVIAYYFHGEFRCPTCNAMEKYTREAIDTHFKDALGSGKLVFKSVNVEEPGNEYFVKQYQLYTKSLILSLVKDGKQIKSKNLDKIWELSRNEQKFIAYVAGEIRDLLKEAQ
jgi:hypothetical protein